MIQDHAISRSGRWACPRRALSLTAAPYFILQSGSSLFVDTALQLMTSGHSSSVVKGIGEAWCTIMRQRLPERRKMLVACAAAAASPSSVIIEMVSVQATHATSAATVTLSLLAAMDIEFDEAKIAIQLSRMRS